MTKKLFRLCCAAFGLAVPVLAQQYVISTVAGGSPLPTPIQATSAPLAGISGIAADAAGNVFFASANCVFKVDASGVLTRIGGTGRAGYSGDGGPAVNAQFNNPQSIALDKSGNIYVGELQRVRRISPFGIITTVAGGGGTSYFGYGAGMPATAVSFGYVSGLALDSTGDIFISDSLGSLVWMVTPAGLITTVAGAGSFGYTGDGGPAIHARLSQPRGLAVDGSGNLYIADTNNNCIRKVGSNGIITTVAGTGFAGFSGDGGPAANAQLSYPGGVALDSAGNLLIADYFNARIRRVSASGTMTTVAGGGTGGDGGPATSAQLALPMDIAVDGTGNVLFDESSVRAVGAGDFGAVLIDPASGILQVSAFLGTYAGGGYGPSTLRRISGAGTISTIAGTGARAQFGRIQGVASDSAGNLFIADSAANYVFKVSPSGILNPVAGSGTAGFSGDGGPATSAQLAYPVGVAVDASGNLFIADQGNGRIRKVSSGGVISTVAGDGNAGYSGDGGPALSAAIARPAGVAVDHAGNLFVLDSTNAVVRKVSVNGTISTFAGNGNSGYSGDGGPAANAELDYPSGIAVDAAGNLFIADTYNYMVRMVSASGVITTVAGGAGYGSAGDGGQAVSASLNSPTAVTVDATGNLFIGCSGTVRMVSKNGVISTIAGNGNGIYGDSGDGGPATSAQIGYGYSMSVDSLGNLDLADYYDNVVRQLTPVNQPVLISSVVDAASESASPLSPGKIVVIYGGGLGSSNGVTAVPSKGVFGTQLAGTTVLFNGIAAPVYYASATQVNAIVPYEISGTTANVTVAYQGGISAAFSVPVAASSPSFFSYNATGAGQAAAINVFDGTPNTAANPVKIGQYISFYATGEGQTNPAGVDGKLAGLPLPAPTLPVSVTVGGLPAVVQYSGAVYGAVAGLMQVNVQIPPGVTPGGYVPVVLKVGSASTVNGALWIAVSN